MIGAKRYLIVNADDFGRSAGVNRGVIEAHEHGIVTSASLMVRWPTASEAAAYSRGHPALSLGLHVDLGEWMYRHDHWELLYEVAPENDLPALSEEVARQLMTFQRLTGRTPSHLDSHQHVHHSEPARSVLIDLADKLAVPLRGFSPWVRYCGDFYGQSGVGEPYPEGISVSGLVQILSGLPTGITELGCHPAVDDDFESMYRTMRADEVRVLCDPQARAVLSSEGIELCSFRDIPPNGRDDAHPCFSE